MLKSLIDINEEALTYWSYNGYTSKDIDSYARENDNKYLMLKISFTEAGLLATVSQRVSKAKEGHAPAIIDLFQTLLDKFGNDGLRGDIFIWLEDGIWGAVSSTIPTLGYCRWLSDRQGFLIPDPAYWGSHGYKQELNEIEKTDQITPWDKKLNSLFWRGASSGWGIENLALCENTPRIKACLYSKNLSRTDLIDVKLSKIVKFEDSNVYEYIDNLNITAGFKSFSEFQKYKFQLDMDGVFNAWMSCFMKLATESALFKIYSDVEQWYYRDLIAWKHYIPVKADLSDFKEHVEWARNHDSDSQAIGENGKKFIAGLEYDGLLKQLHELIIQILKFQKSS